MFENETIKSVHKDIDIGNLIKLLAHTLTHVGLCCYCFVEAMSTIETDATRQKRSSFGRWGIRLQIQIYGKEIRIYTYDTSCET